MRASGLCTPEGSNAYARRFEGTLAREHFRSWNGLSLSSIGLGTYLGPYDDETDRRYQAAVLRALEMGCNVIDTAVNYRFQRSERAVGEALAGAFASGVRREAVLVCTKGGFFPFDSRPPADPAVWVEETFIRPGIVSPGDIVAGSHCMAPAYLGNQLDTSLRNLRLQSVDVYYVHNPETQLNAVDRAEFQRRIRAAFELLEGAARDGRIGCYGTATWNGFRQPLESPEHLSLAELVDAARTVGGDGHHFRAVQLPVNLAMAEAVARPNQKLNGRLMTLLEAASKLGMIVMSSGSILQGQLAAGLPPSVAGVFQGLDSDAQRALQFTRSAPGVTTALVGMKSLPHVEENLALARRPPASPDVITKLFR